MSENDIKKFKLIFDYSQDYDTYMEQLTQDNHKCTENYKDYLQKYVNSYNELESECKRDENSYKYCGNFKTYFSNKDPGLLSTRIRTLEVTNEQINQIKEDSTGDTGHTKLQPTLTPRSGSEGQSSLSGSLSDGSSTVYSCWDLDKQIIGEGTKFKPYSFKRF
ncbi:Plasmodium vivax Vir protein, putative [Plasmodium vivax]|uniref:Vir protein, putative n=1 Tax=Plasmodium vivax TaxID=5855 RepID=A0A1G4EI02_PLAVI|nr:Plasmodium vivax Vir protein, putative [Plasmodium vivax]